MLAYQTKSTLPVGVPPAWVPATAAESCTTEPIGAAVTGLWFASWMVVTACAVNLVASSGSQGPSDCLWLPSPL